MKMHVRNLVLTGIFAMAASGMAMAEASNAAWFEQWHRAKYGRPAPSEVTRLAAAQANQASQVETSSQAAVPANSWHEQWHRAKFGRPSPSEEARIRELKSTVAVEEEASLQKAAHGNTWHHSWYRAKFGRPSVLEETSSSAEAR